MVVHWRDPNPDAVRAAKGWDRFYQTCAQNGAGFFCWIYRQEVIYEEKSIVVCSNEGQKKKKETRLDDQIADCREYAEEHGYTVSYELKEEPGLCFRFGYY